MPAHQASQKKGLHPMAWVGMGCGGLLVIAIIAVALVVGWGKRKFSELQDEFASSTYDSAARIMVEMHPDLEMVMENPETGEVTVRVSSTGEQLSFDPEELAHGSVTIKGSDGTEMILGQGDLADVPAWVPRYPGVLDERALFNKQGAGGSKGLLSFSSGDTPVQVEDFYDKELGRFSSSGSSSLNFGSVEQRTLTYGEGTKEVEVTIVVPGAGDATQVTLSYEDKSPVTPGRP
jgi:hypothetical protein